MRLSRQQSRHDSIRGLTIPSDHFSRTLVISKASSYMQYVSQFLGTSKGRDKFMALFQYTFDFYHSCAKHSNIDEILIEFASNDLKSVLVADSFKESISQARKITRILRFLDEIKGLQRLQKMNKPWLFILLSLVGHLSSFMYYVADNVLWAAGLMVRNGVLTQRTEHIWKNRKNTFSQINVIVNIIRLSVLLVMRDTKERKLEQELNRIPAQRIDKGSRPHQIVLSLIKLRRKRRFEIIDLIVSILRFFMLTKSLKTTGYQYLHPIFVATCGLLSAAISLFKAVYEKKIFIQLDFQPKAGNKSLASAKTQSVIKVESQRDLLG